MRAEAFDRDYLLENKNHLHNFVKLYDRLYPFEKLNEICLY